MRNYWGRIMARLRSREAAPRLIRGEAPSAQPPATWMPIGHFYSPLPNLEEVRQDEDRIFRPAPRSLPGIDLNEPEQLALLEEFISYYPEQPFSAYKQDGLRYFFENQMYSYSDAICLYSMIRHLKPRKIIELGCGYSSSVMLDTNELFFQNQIQCTFIDPYMEALLGLLKEGDEACIEMIPKRAQDVELARYKELAANDILFIDSSHVCKTGSDVNYLLFEVLPVLNSGVYIHFHDIFYPFEYPLEWVYEGRAWTETYLLQAFLQYNQAFKIVFFNTFLERFHEETFRKHMDLCLENPGGSIWITKV